MLLSEIPWRQVYRTPLNISPAKIEQFHNRFTLSEPTGYCSCRIGEYCPHITDDNKLYTRESISYTTRVRDAVQPDTKNNAPERNDVKFSEIPKDALPKKSGDTKDGPIRLASLKKGTVLMLNATEIQKYKSTKGEDKERTIVVGMDGKKYNVSRPIFNVLHAGLEYIKKVATEAYQEAYAQPNLSAAGLAEITEKREADSVLEVSVTFDANDRVGIA